MRLAQWGGEQRDDGAVVEREVEAGGRGAEVARQRAGHLLELGRHRAAGGVRAAVTGVQAGVQQPLVRHALRREAERPERARVEAEAARPEAAGERARQRGRDGAERVGRVAVEGGLVRVRVGESLS